MSKQQKMKLKGRLGAYTRWPMILSSLLIVMNIGIFFLDKKAALVTLCFVLLYILISVCIYFGCKNSILAGLVDFATGYGQVQKQLLKEFSLPYALLDENARFIWCNEAFGVAFGKDLIAKRPITALIPEIKKEILPVSEDVDVHFSFGDKDYHAVLHRVSMQETMSGSGIVAASEFGGSLIALYLFDETQLNEYIRRNREESLVTGIIYMDNYDEALESVENVRKSLLTALIDRKINKYFSDMDAIVRKTEVDKYFVVMKRKAMETLEERKFDILEEVKTVNIGNAMAVTLSMGFGLDTACFEDQAEYAKSAIDLALGRGGDQAVIKSPQKVSYYGGKSQQVEKNTRVKARVKAHALKELIESREQVLVMGHSNCDVDSFGAAVGIFRASQYLGKPCHIVINEVTSAISGMLDDFVHSPDYEEGVLISGADAVQMVNANTMLVVVDTNRPSITECPDLLTACKTIVVLDHHRQGNDKISNATLSYIEPYASSACEMVSEILQYIGDNIKIMGVEADCLYAGILIDTNNFVSKTGVRTFEAAAFLRRNGADVTRVRKIFRNDIEDYQARAKAVQDAELYRDHYAISVCPSEGISNPTVVCAQAANELLDINSVKASFVLTWYQNKIFYSARSIDEVNVQVIMERLGGGGHMTIAGAQLEGHTLEEGVDIMKNLLDEMIEAGDL